jgi:hypothetical protein
MRRFSPQTSRYAGHKHFLSKILSALSGLRVSNPKPHATLAISIFFQKSFAFLATLA